jgi:ATP-dependent Clp protease ATP-binding subunit ClpA
MTKPILSDMSEFIWDLASAEALSSNFEFVEREHLFISLSEAGQLFDIAPKKEEISEEQRARAKEEYQMIESLFYKLNIDPVQLRGEIRNSLGEGKAKRNRDTIERSEECEKIFDRSFDIATGSDIVDCIHLFQSLMIEPGLIITNVLKAFGVDPQLFLSMIAESEHLEESESASFPSKSFQYPKNVDELNKFGTNLVLNASKGLLLPCYGREKEIHRLIDTLSSKELPVLIGNKGVGKGIIIETLAVRIWKNAVPSFLKKKHIYKLDLSTIFREVNSVEDFNSTLRQIFAEAERNQDIILYIKDIYKLLKSGTPPNIRDSVRILKESISQCKVRIIAVSDERSWRNNVETDSQITCKFKKISVNESTSAETLDILKVWKPKLEVTHGMRITERALYAAVDLAVKFALPGSLPKKAIEILSSACMSAHIPIWKLEDNQAKEIAEEIIYLSKKLTLDMKPDVNEVRVAKAVYDVTGKDMEILVSNLRGIMPAGIFGLEKNLKQTIFGQSDAIEKASSHVLNHYRKLKNDEKKTPLALIFAGASGLGKRMLVENLCKALFDDTLSLCVMSIDKNVDSPDFAKIAKFIKRKPFSVVLIENIENINPNYINMLGMSFESGEMRVNEETIDISKAIFVLSSSHFSESRALVKTQKTVQNVKNYFPTKFMSTIRDVVVFNPISEQTATRILVLWLEEEVKKVKEEHGISLGLSRELNHYLLDEGMAMGCRVEDLKKSFENLFVLPLKNFLSSSESKSYKQWKTLVINNRVSFVPRLSNEKPNL